MSDKLLFVTGGAGFIGSALVRLIIQETNYQVVNIDKLTYAGNLESLALVSQSPRYFFHQVDIADKLAITDLFNQYNPDGVIHLAAESHVDRSIVNAADFIQTNIVGTYNLLECTRAYLARKSKPDFKFIHVSTDEVFGSLTDEGYFNETTSYDPSSPYSASKASSDLLVRAWQRTYNFPAITTNCTNNYGPYHFPEKLIPLVINNALQNKPLPVYGKGNQIRDWLYVEDHVRGLLTVYQSGQVGQAYCVGGKSERTNLEVVESICDILDELKPRLDGSSYRQLITFVKDRDGHDYRYAMDISKLQSQLGWQPLETFTSGIKKTVAWFLANQQWVAHVQSGEYQSWVAQNYTHR